MIEWREIAMEIRPLLDIHNQQQFILGISWLLVFILINILAVRYLLQERIHYQMLYGAVIFLDMFLVFNMVKHFSNTAEIMVYQMNNLRQQTYLHFGVGANVQPAGVYAYYAEKTYRLEKELVLHNNKPQEFYIQGFTIENLFYETVEELYQTILDSMETNAYKQFIVKIDTTDVEEKESQLLIFEQLIAEKRIDFIHQKLAENKKNYFFALIRTNDDAIPYLLLDNEGNTKFEMWEEKLKERVLKNK